MSSALRSNKNQRKKKIEQHLKFDSFHSKHFQIFDTFANIVAQFQWRILKSKQMANTVFAETRQRMKALFGQCENKKAYIFSI